MTDLVGDSGNSEVDPLGAAYAHHFDRLVRLCLLLSGNLTAGEDLAQETFIRAARHLNRLPSDAQWPYLRKAAANNWNNVLRRRRLESRERSEENAPTGWEELVDERDRLWRAISLLSPRQKSCIVLRYYEDLSTKDIARVLRVSQGSVKTHLSRARHTLREALDG